MTNKPHPAVARINQSVKLACDLIAVSVQTNINVHVFSTALFFAIALIFPKETTSGIPIFGLLTPVMTCTLIYALYADENNSTAYRAIAARVLMLSSVISVGTAAIMLILFIASSIALSS